MEQAPICVIVCRPPELRRAAERLVRRAGLEPVAAVTLDDLRGARPDVAVLIEDSPSERRRGEQALRTMGARRVIFVSEEGARFAGPHDGWPDAWLETLDLYQLVELLGPRPPGE